MKYGFMPALMWAAFRGTFENALRTELNVFNSKEVMKKSHRDYRQILADVDKFEKGSRFLVNILSCAMLSSVLLNLEQKPTAKQVQNYYRKAMSRNFFMRCAAKRSKSYTEKGRNALKAAAKKSQKITNPYDWKFTIVDGETINQYTATFYTCGICRLMTKLNLSEYIPAMCAFDYDMAAMNNTEFTREFTLAAGGPCCDCHYNYKGKRGMKLK
ncbi:MAG: L-2-amino-thiazoline-4-carboxylic acid hydrolase [Oscillospiraceae bacterium]|nr:L-2-amino-thiazoline-4-carboxylic acid hydrolase [Oscillospiraceae bacterium]